VQPDGTWSVTLPGDHALADGSYTAVATVTDAAGNSTSATGTITINTVVPTLAVNSQTTNNTTPTITGTSNAPAGTTVTVTVNDKTYTTTITAEGTWSVIIPATDSLPEGDYTVTASVTDTAGNTGTATGALKIDTTAPVVSVNPLTTNNTTPTITGSSDAPAGTTVTVTVNDKTYTTTITAEGTWSVIIPAADALPEGEHTVTATVTDTAGNTGTGTGALTIDTTAPTLTINNQNTNNTTPTIAGMSNEIGGTVTLVLNGISYSATVQPDGSWSVTIPDDHALADGNYTAEATITDAAGNTTTVSGTITINTTVPTVSVDVVVTNTGTPTISGTSDAPEGSSVVVTINGKDYTTTVTGEGTWSVTIPGDDALARWRVSNHSCGNRSSG
jgi:large repetitive protein